jgi:hypothetical protein
MQLLNAMLSRFVRIGTLRIIDAEGCALASVARTFMPGSEWRTGYRRS